MDFQAGILMIDDGCAPYYGKWQFRKDNFADAKGMIKTASRYGLPGHALAVSVYYSGYCGIQRNQG